MAVKSIAQLIEGGARVVDVRSEDEFDDGAYPGAVNIPVGALMANLARLEPKDKPIVVYCASGSRSAMAARILKASGWAEVVNAGGLDDMPGN